MKKLFLFLLPLTYSLRMLAQNAPSIEWQKCLGGSELDVANSIQQTADGGFIVAGHSYSNDGDVSGNHGNGDYWITKLNSSGDLQWQKSLGGANFDGANSIRQTTDGGFIVAGFSASNDGDVSGNQGDYDYWIVKLDSSGMIQWQKCLGAYSDDRATSIQQTIDGNFIVIGSGYGYATCNGGEDYWFTILDSFGNEHGKRCLGGSDDDWANSIQQTTDGGFIIAGTSWSNDEDVSGNHGNDDYWIVKLDSSGNIEWQKCFGGSLYDRANSIQQTIDGGFIIAGSSNSNDGDVTSWHEGYDGFGYPTDDFWIVKLNSEGDLQWQKSLGGNDADQARSIHQTTDGGFIVAGWALSNNADVSGNHGAEDDWIVKLDSLGVIQWQKCLGGSYDEVAHYIQQTTGGGYIIAGESNSIDGDVSGNHGFIDYWIVKLSPDVTGIPSMGDAETFSVYPNPANEYVTISATFNTPQSLVIKFTDVVGRDVLSFDEGIVTGQFTAQHDLRSLSSGIYFLKMIHDGRSEMRKVEVEK